MSLRRFYVIVSCIFSACHLILIKVSSKTYQLRFIITTCIDSAISVCCLRMISMLYQFSVSYQSQLALSYKQSLRWTQVSIVSKLSQPGTIWLMQNADGTVSFRELLGQTKVMQIRQGETLNHQWAITHEVCCLAAQKYHCLSDPK